MRTSKARRKHSTTIMVLFAVMVPSIVGLLSSARAADDCGGCERAEFLAKSLERRATTGQRGKGGPATSGSPPAASASAAPTSSNALPHSDNEGKGSPESSDPALGPKEAFAELRRIFADKAKQCTDAKREGRTQSPSPCDELERIRGALVRGTLGFLTVLKKRGLENPANLKAASEAINAAFVLDVGDDVGLVRMLVDVVAEAVARGLDARSLIGSLNLVSDPNVVKHLQKRIAASEMPVPESLSEAASGEKIDPKRFLAAVVGLDRAWQARVQRWLEEGDPSYRHKLYSYMQNAKSVLVLARRPPKADDELNLALREFVNTFVLYLAAKTTEGPYLPRYIDRDQWAAEVAAAASKCRANTNQSCDVVLAFCTDLAGGSFDTGNSCHLTTASAKEGRSLRIKAELTFVQETGERPKSDAEEPLEAEIPLGESGKLSALGQQVIASDAQLAAGALMQRLATRIEISGGAMAMAQEGLIRVMRAQREGVTIFGRPACLSAKRKKELGGAGLKVKGSCGTNFDARMREGLEFFSANIGTIDQVAAAVPTLTIQPDSSKAGSCRGKLMAEGETTPIYEFLSSVESATNAREGDAGADAAGHLGALYVGPSCDTAGVQPTPPPPRERVGPTHRLQALAVTGLPWMTDGRETSGDRWALGASIADGVLFLGGAAALAYSTRLRDQYARYEISSLSGADTLRTIGVVTLGAVVVSRLVGVVIYPSDDGSDSKSPSVGASRVRLSVTPAGIGISYQ